MIWVLGSNGMLGKDVVSSLKKGGYDVLESGRSVDISSMESLMDFVHKNTSLRGGIEYIINCAAYTEVDKAEFNPGEAYLVNSTGAANIAMVAKYIDKPLIHISTDYVFSGEEDTPLLEDHQTSPINVYGASKLAGEHQVRHICEKHFILRTSWLYGNGGNNFVLSMLNLMNNRSSIDVVSDQWGSPTYTRSLVNQMIYLIRKRSDKYGTYHFSGEGRTSWHGFAQEIYNISRSIGLIDQDVEIVPVTSDKFHRAAKRPMYSLLSKVKVVSVFGIGVEEWEGPLKRYLEDIKNGTL